MVMCVDVVSDQPTDRTSSTQSRAIWQSHLNIYDMGPTALLPLRREWCSGFLSPLKIHRPRSGSNPRTLGPVPSTLTTSPPRATASHMATAK
jgi:hypothetical protein